MVRTTFVPRQGPNDVTWGSPKCSPRHGSPRRRHDPAVPLPLLRRLARWPPDETSRQATIGRSYVVLRDERDGRDVRHLEAHLDDEGNLVFEGHDLGPGTAPVHDDGDYEWFETIAALYRSDIHVERFIW